MLVLSTMPWLGLRRWLGLSVTLALLLLVKLLPPLLPLLAPSAPAVPAAT